MSHKCLFVILSSFFIQSCFFEIVDPGNKGVKVTLGQVENTVYDEGLHYKSPFISSIREVNVRQQSAKIVSDCFSSDLQHIRVNLRVLYSVPVNNVVAVFRNYQDDPFAGFVEPKINEAFKEVTASRTAEVIVKEREKVKVEALKSSQEKVNGFLTIHDVVIEDLQLSVELQRAIESKMVQEQTAAKAKFYQVQERTDAETKVIKARGEAEAMEIINKTLKNEPAYLQLEMIKKWDGKAPLVVGQTNGNFMLPLKKE